MLVSSSPSLLDTKNRSLNQCSESLGEYAFSSKAKAFVGFHVLRMENSFQIPPLIIELFDDVQESDSSHSQHRHV